MQSMNFAEDGSRKSRFFAGLYLRTPKRTRFWGWGQPPVRSTSTAPTDERPWAALGDWLRAAHALFGSGSAEHAPVEAADAPSFASTETASTRQTDNRREAWEKKRKLRFVCNRHVIGFVID